MNGLLSEPQEFVLETLRQFNALRLDQIKWLLQTKYKDRYGAINIRSVMRQLAYMGKVRAQENLWCALWRKPVPALIDAFDVMMLMCDDTVPQFRVEHDQCQLTFYLPGEAGGLPNSFKVYYVIGGQEMDACETACARRDPLGHTVLYVVSSLAQIERLYCNKPFFAALKGGDSRIEFFQGISNE